MPEYLEVPIETDPELLAEAAIARLQAVYPGWVPAAGNLETILIEVVARMAAEIRDVAGRVPRSIFRTFGLLVGVPPIDASRATTTSTWTMRDNAGYTIPAGTIVGLRTAGDELVTFETVEDVTVPPGSTVTGTGQVVIVATIAGEAGSGLGAPAGPLELVDPIDYVLTATVTAATTGGVDAETDNAYLDRLRATLQLMAPRPILPNDFAVMAQSIAGVDRALALDGYNAEANELQTVTVTNATGGTFTLTFSGQTTAAIARNASAATVQAALEALSNIAVGDVVCTGGPLGTAFVQIEFRGAYAGTNVASITADGTLLTGAGAAVVATTTRQGSATTGNERMVTVALVDEAGQPVTSITKAAVDALLEAEREVNFVVYVIDATYTTIDVNFTVTVYDGFLDADVVARAEAAVEDLISPANWGLPNTGDQRLWIERASVGYLEVATAINNVEGVDEVTILQIRKAGGSFGTANVALAGPAGLPEVGAITGAAA